LEVVFGLKKKVKEKTCTRCLEERKY